MKKRLVSFMKNMKVNLLTGKLSEYATHLITVVIKVFYAYKIQTFLFTFCCDDWVTLGPLKLSRVNLVCSCEDFMKSP